MRHQYHLISWIVAGFIGSSIVASDAGLASGGDLEPIVYECTSRESLALVVFRLHEAYSSELRGDALVYANKNNRQQMLTSMNDCYELGTARLNSQVTKTEEVTQVKGASHEFHLICGNRDLDAEKKTKQDKLPLLGPNKSGYLARVWKSSASGSDASMVQAQLKKRDARGELTPVLGNFVCSPR